MNPLFFGPRDEALFGVHHPPTGGEPRDHAVLICPPFGHEYMRTHWALRLVAERLARSGFHVLRFDYRGTGDSSGEMIDFTPAHWREDILTAAEELRALAGLGSLSVVGMRLGAALALTTPGARWHRAACWAPVVDGRHYREEMETIHRGYLENFNASHGASRPVIAGEFLGQQFNEGALAALEGIDLMKNPPPAQALGIVTAPGERERAEGLQRRARESAIPARLVVCDDAGDWSRLTAMGSAIQAGETITALATFIEGEEKP